MASAPVTSKGQVTIPVDVRTKLGLRAGSRFTFIPTPPAGYEIHVEGVSIRDLKGVVERPSSRAAPLASRAAGPGRGRAGCRLNARPA